MEEKNVDASTSGGTPASSRWNPTKEQISVLEGLYRQGIRTPSAEQIQQITSRLREHGQIEGKNVFYWFQNHKARQRQKQKQENMVYINRFLHKATPILPPPTPCTNVVCSSFGVPPSGVGFYPQFSKVLLPGGVRRRQRGDKMVKMNESIGDGYECTHTRYDNMDITNGSERNIHTTSAQETLQLFPLHPTGILEGRSVNSSPSSDFPTEDGGGYHNPFFNFFEGHGPCESK